MNRITQLRDYHNAELKKHCNSNQIDFSSVNILLDAEKTKKFLKRNALIQQTIDKEIEIAIENENR